MTQPAQSAYAYAQVWVKELRKNKPVEKYYEDSKITKLSFFLIYSLFSLLHKYEIFKLHCILN